MTYSSDFHRYRHRSNATAISHRRREAQSSSRFYQCLPISLAPARLRTPVTSSRRNTPVTRRGTPLSPFLDANRLTRRTRRQKCDEGSRIPFTILCGGEALEGGHRSQTAMPLAGVANSLGPGPIVFTEDFGSDHFDPN